MPQPFTSWESIYLTLRAAFPNESYHTGATLERFEGTRVKASLRILSGMELLP
jgi:hypothetical protein